MNYATIKYYDIANGIGVRTSLFVSGCTHRCKGCFNEVAWDFAYGEPFTQEVIDKILDSMSASYVQGLSLLGGEPFEIENQRGLMPLLRQFHERYPEKDIWCYTGYILDKDLMAEGGRARCEVTDEFLSYLHVLVDGPFVESLRNLMLKFRGSENQRLIDMKETLKNGEVTLLAIEERR